MRRIYIFFIFCVISFFLVSQNKTDSLSGFSSQEYFELANKKNLDEKEKNFFIQSLERTYIKQKYGIKDEVTKNPKPDISILAGNNIDFELGTLSGWTTETYSRISIGSTVPNNLSANFSGTGGKSIIISSGLDAIGNFSLSSPIGGNFITKIGDNNLTGNKVYVLRNLINVNTTENLLKFAYANVFEYSTHECAGNPYIAIRILDTAGTVLFNYFSIAPETSIPGNSPCAGYNTANYTFTTYLGKSYYYSNWESRCVDLSPYIGKNIILEVASSECAYSAHRGYSYFDATLSTCPLTGNPNYLNISGNNYLLNYNYIKINDLPCNGPNMSVTAPAWPTSYIWDGPPTSGIKSYTNASFSTSEGGLYTLSMGSGTNCPIVKTISITPRAPITLTISTTNTVCIGKSTVISVSGATSYTWSDGSKGNSIIVAPTASLTYSVIGSNDITGCTGTTSITINPLPSPTLSISGPTLACTGASVILTANGANTYTWSTSVNTNSAYVSASTATTFSYNVIGAGPNGCLSTSPTFYLTYQNASPVSINPSSINACPNTTYNATAYSSIPSTYSWSNGANTSSISCPPVSTVLIVTCLNSCGTSTAALSINAVSAPTISLTTPTVSCLNAGNTVFNSGAQTYTYMSPAQTTTASGAMGLIFPSPLGLVTYTAIGADINGCKDTTNFSLFVNPNPSFAISPTILCYNTSNTITATGSANTYTWYPSIGSPSINTPSITLTPTNSVNYTVVGANSFGCTSSISQLFLPNATYSINLLANTTTVCPGSSATITAYNCNTYTWSTGQNSSSIIVSPTTTTTYSVLGTNACGTFSNSINIIFNPTTVSPIIVAGNFTVCSGTMQSYTATGASTYTWQGGGTSNIVNLVIPPTNSINITYKDINNCLSTYTQNLTILPSPTVNIVGTNTVCVGNNVTLTANGALTYSWSTGSTSNSIVISPTVNTNYVVTGYDANGCADNNASTIFITPKPTVSITPSQSLTCPGSTLSLVASSSGTYSWSTGSNSNSIVVTPTNGAVYSTTYTNLWGCSTSTSITVYLASNPITIAPFSPTICVGSSPLTFTTSPSGSILNGMALSNLTFTPYVPGNYTQMCKFTDANNCLFSLANNITVLPPPNVTFSATSYNSCIGGGNISLIGTPSGGIFTGTNVISGQFQPISAGQNCVVYQFTDSFGCENYEQKCFYVDLCTGINNHLSNSFISIFPNPTQNYLTVINNISEKLQIEIYDVIGKQIINQMSDLYETKIDLTEFANGIYFIKVLKNKKNIYNVKIIKQ